MDVHCKNSFKLAVVLETLIIKYWRKKGKENGVSRITLIAS